MLEGQERKGAWHANNYKKESSILSVMGEGSAGRNMRPPQNHCHHMCTADKVIR